MGMALSCDLFGLGISVFHTPGYFWCCHLGRPGVLGRLYMEIRPGG